MQPANRRAVRLSPPAPSARAISSTSSRLAPLFSRDTVRSTLHRCAAGHTAVSASSRTQSPALSSIRNPPSWKPCSRSWPRWSYPSISSRVTKPPIVQPPAGKRSGDGAACGLHEWLPGGHVQQGHQWRPVIRRRGRQNHRQKKLSEDRNDELVVSHSMRLPPNPALAGFVVSALRSPWRRAPS